MNKCCVDVCTSALLECLLVGRSQTGVCTVDDEIVAVGGCDAWNSTNTVEIYDRANNKWSYLPSMSLARRGVGVASFKGKITLWNVLDVDVHEF